MYNLNLRNPQSRLNICQFYIVFNGEVFSAVVDTASTPAGFKRFCRTIRDLTSSDPNSSIFSRVSPESEEYLTLDEFCTEFSKFCKKLSNTASKKHN